MTGQLLAFAAATSVLIAIPGPSVLFTVGRALAAGRRGALLTVVGGAGGAYVQVVAVAVGLGAIVERSAEAYTVLKLAGAAYLIYLGVQAIRHHRPPAADAPAVARTARPVRDGFVVGVTNPKMIVFLTAALPQFVDREAGGLALQMLVLGLVVPAISLVSDSLWALAAGTARSWFADSPRRIELLGVAGGVAMIGIGAVVAVSRRNS
jgi:threonine/homoserine/homoserine lactone efflux protein